MRPWRARGSIGEGAPMAATPQRNSADDSCTLPPPPPPPSRSKGRLRAALGLGEARLTALLDGLHIVGALALHDRCLPRSRRTFDDVVVDHLVVTTAGLWVIDAKPCSGPLTLTVEGAPGPAQALTVQDLSGSALLTKLQAKVDRRRHGAGHSRRQRGRRPGRRLPRRRPARRGTTPPRGTGPALHLVRAAPARAPGARPLRRGRPRRPAPPAGPLLHPRVNHSGVPPVPPLGSR